MSLRDEAWLSDGRNEITGPAAGLQHQAAERAGPDAARDPAATDRVRITIQPKNGSGTPVRRKTAPETESMSVLRATHLAKSYNTRQVVPDLSLEVESGADRRAC